MSKNNLVASGRTQTKIGWLVNWDLVAALDESFCCVFRVGESLDKVDVWDTSSTAKEDPNCDHRSSLFGTSWSSLDSAWHNVSTLDGAAIKDITNNASSSTWIMTILVTWFVVQFWQLLQRKAKRRRMIPRRRKTVQSVAAPQQQN